MTVVVEFALALMSVLDQINRESFQRFRLRIGLNHGPVIGMFDVMDKPKICYNLLTRIVDGNIDLFQLALLVLKSHSTTYGVIQLMWHHVWIHAVSWDAFR